ncbi:MAG: PelD GGDEF domain-containing protein [Aquificaceae bacterium]|nr:PelD GGDEF domain-containing protein [Aquificaceae bacterium]MDW8423390.1 PelD GGDEF domain-containing protein [Aquificaceae bacterium]
MFSLGNIIRQRLTGFGKDEYFRRGTNLKIVLVEVTIFLVLVYAIGFFLNKEDPLFMNNRHSIAIHLLPLAVLTLYYGFIVGTIYTALFTAIQYFIYNRLEGSYLLYLFLFLLIFSEFHFYWNRILQQNQERVEYISDKLRGIAKSLYVLKLSHDRLESYHISRPISIRGFLEDVKRDILSGITLEEALKRTFTLVSNLYAIEKAGLYEFRDGKFVNLVSVGGMGELNTKDKLVEYALEHGEAVYIPASAVDGLTTYLCFIPIHFEESLKYAVVIERMPFMNLNKDNILSISMLLYYILWDYYELEAIRDIHKKFEDVDVETIKEIAKCAQLKKRYDVDSSLVVFNFDSWDESIYYLFSDNARGLDYVSKYGDRSMLVLLPLTNLSGAYSFIKRMENVVREFKGANYAQLGISHQTYPVEDAEDILSKLTQREVKV